MSVRAENKQISLKKEFKSLKEAHKVLTNLAKYIETSFEGQEVSDHFVFIGLSYIKSGKYLYKRIAVNKFKASHEFNLLKEDEINAKNIHLNIFYSETINPKIGAKIIVYLNKRFGAKSARRKPIGDVLMFKIMLNSFASRFFQKTDQLSFRDYRECHLTDVQTLNRKALKCKDEFWELNKMLTQRGKYKIKDNGVLKSKAQFEREQLKKMVIIPEKSLNDFKNGKTNLSIKYKKKILELIPSLYIKLRVMKNRERNGKLIPIPQIVYFNGTLENFKMLNLNYFKQGRYAKKLENDLVDLIDKLILI